MTINYDKIYECAASARKNAYAPYSEFAVGLRSCCATGA